MIKKLFKSLLTTAIMLFMSVSMFAQSVRITGTVVDEAGEPIIGAAVLEAGTTNGVATDLDGAFAFNTPKGAKIEVSFIGYVTQTFVVSDRTTYDVVLAEDTQLLEETVVIGYGVQKKSDVTGAIASVRSTDLQNRSNSNAASALQGKASGVQVLNSSAAPGQGSEIRVRGYSSNSANIGPLMIVDGLKVDNIQYLDPSMIESMEILKDAASAAIYGAEAGNGVVLITTKAGQKADQGKGNVFYNYQITANSLGKTAEVMNAEQYIGFGKEAGTINDNLLQQVGYDGKMDTDWADAVFTTSFTQKHTIGAQGANDRGSYYLSITNLNDDGIVRGDKDVYKRLSAQVNADYKINDWIQVGTNTSFEKWATQSVGEHSEYSGSVLLGALIMDPLTPVYYENESDLPLDLVSAISGKKQKVFQNENGKYYAVSKLQESDAGNPLAMRDMNNAKSDGINVRGTFYTNITTYQKFVFTSRFGYRIAQSYSSDYDEPYYICGRANSNTYTVTATSSTSYYYQWENFANYNFNINKHNVALMAGMSYIENNARSVGGTVSGTNPLTGYEENFRYLPYANSSATKTISGGSPSQSSSLAYFGRLSWNYADRYNFQANFRADAFDSSKLSAKNRWGYFPSFSAGWTISNEEFMSGVDKSAISFLKLRASWGRNGNISVLNNYPYSTSINLNSKMIQWDPSSNKVSYGSIPTGLANPNLTWETSEQLDLGLDARFFNNRLSFAFDYFDKNTKDLLVAVAPVAELGISGTTTVNAGSVNNKGFEFELGWKNQIGDFSYSLNANLSYLQNKVTYLDPTISRITGAGYSGSYLQTYFESGYPVWYMRGYVYDGVNTDGTPKYKDLSNDGAINSDDMTMVGSGIPDYTYGITANFAYKNFDLTIFGTGVGGNDVFACLFRVDRPRVNSLAYFYENRWTEANTSASMPKLSSIVSDQIFWSSTADLFDGSYFKIKQIQLGYSIPKSTLEKIGLSGLRVYGSLDDFFIFTKYPGFDPEVASSGGVNSAGFDKGSFPTSKKAVLGVNITF